MKSLYLESPYPQPVDGGEGPRNDRNHEFIDHLPHTNIRIWYSAFSQFYPDHWHNETEIVVGQSGTYTIQVDGNIWDIQKGDILIVPGKIIHSLDMSNDCHGFVYFFDLESFKDIPTYSTVSPLLTKPLFIKKSNTLLYQSAFSILEQTRNEYFSKNDFRELMVYSHVLNLLAQIGRSYSMTTANLTHLRSDKREEYTERFNDILTWINENYFEDITLEFISKKFGFSKYHFSRLFSQYTNHTFSEYLTFQRLKAAEELLRNSDLSITDISTQVGFNSISTFSQIFKNKNHCTPSEFRKISLPDQLE